MRGSSSSHQALELAVFLQPWTFLLVRGIVDALCTSHGQDIKVSDPGSVVADALEWDANFMLSIEHHVILPQAALTVVHAHHALLHFHLLWSRAPGERVILSSLRSLAVHRPGERNAVLGERQTFLAGLADGATAGNVGATPDVLARDTSGMC